jgi:hypothetical protein
MLPLHPQGVVYVVAGRSQSDFLPLDLLIANQGMNINIGPEGKGESWEQTNLLLDVNLRGQLSYPVADALDAKGIPYAFTSGYGAGGIDARFSGATVIGKPIDAAQLTAFVKSIPTRGSVA